MEQLIVDAIRSEGAPRAQAVLKQYDSNLYEPGDHCEKPFLRGSECTTIRNQYTDDALNCMVHAFNHAMNIVVFTNAKQALERLNQTNRNYTN